nr:VOC family protein [Cyanobium sp. Cruz CV11-17]
MDLLSVSNPSSAHDPASDHVTIVVRDHVADHLTLVLAVASPWLEVQLLHYRHPEPLPDPAIENLARVGFNHICFAVDDLEATVARLQAGGGALRNAVMDFHHRKLVFLRGPEGITVELAEWKGGAAS